MNQFKLQPGDYLINVSRGKDPFSVIKRWAMGSPFSHVFRYMGELFFEGRGATLRVPKGIPFLFESNGRGVILQSLSNRNGQEVVVMRLRPAWKERIPFILREAIKLASDPQAYYDYLCIMRFVLPRLILEKLHLPIPLSWQRDRRQICSEAALEIDLRAGVPTLPDNVVPMPGDFVTNSPLLYKVGQGKLSEEWLKEWQELLIKEENG